MQLRYNDQAAERQIAIVGSCGFDSVIADIGVEAIRQEYEQKDQGIHRSNSFYSSKLFLS
jgi:short subunit dehydrogenase-like uncharacterized protein